MGIFIALPNGPVSFIIMRRMYVQGLRVGMYSAFGALLMDLFYLTCVGFGLSLVSMIPKIVIVLGKMFAGIIILISGYRMIGESVQEIQQEKIHAQPWRNMFSISLLNLLNPGLIVSLGAVFLLFGMGNALGKVHDIATFLVGFSLGSMALWFFIGKVITHPSRYHDGQVLKKVTQAVGYLLVLFGILIVMYGIFLMVG